MQDKELHIRIDEVRYPGGKPVLRDVDVTLPAGSFTAVIGRNGSGKSTLLSCVAGLLPFSGTVTYGGVRLDTLSCAERARRIAMMQQRLRAPHITVSELLAYGRQPYLGMLRRPDASDRAAIADAAAFAALAPLYDRYLDTLSGGELRRAYLGMAAAQDTPVLLLDEPTANLDMDYEEAFLEKLSALQRTRGKTTAAVLHNLSAALTYADRILLIDGGTVRFWGTAEALCASGLLREVFGAQVLRIGGRTAVLPCDGRG
ncbi:MAG: ABC transporter ATP-binding protein [Clostridia bacterium]|nr:ABC transporter ATP-binding protein [Clostridia bacterium]